MSEEAHVPYQAFIVRGQASLPRRFAEVAYRGYCIEGHGGQSFDRLHERGGFGIEELVHFAFVAGRGAPARWGEELGPRTKGNGAAAPEEGEARLTEPSSSSEPSIPTAQNGEGA